MILLPTAERFSAVSRFSRAKYFFKLWLFAMRPR